PLARDGAVDRGELRVAGDLLLDRAAGDVAGDQERERGAERGADEGDDHPLDQAEDRARRERQEERRGEGDRRDGIAEDEDDGAPDPEALYPGGEGQDGAAELLAGEHQSGDDGERHDDQRDRLRATAFRLLGRFGHGGSSRE